MAVDRSSSPSFSSDNVVIKAPNDKRLYRVVHLPNGLCALLIHDPEIYPEGEPSKTLENGDVDDEVVDDMDEDDDDDDDDDDDEEDSEEEEDDKKTGGAAPTKKAAAALCVGMGSFSDPIEAQGLAHFLEHMLFMGSTEFPDENEHHQCRCKFRG